MAVSAPYLTLSDPVKLHRDVSEHPSSGGLTEVVDAQRDADIEKDTQADLRLLAILSALRHG
jgi:hypothetical protein